MCQFAALAVVSPERPSRYRPHLRRGAGVSENKSYLGGPDAKEVLPYRKCVPSDRRVIVQL